MSDDALSRISTSLGADARMGESLRLSTGDKSGPEALAALSAFAIEWGFRLTDTDLISA